MPLSAQISAVPPAAVLAFVMPSSRPLALLAMRYRPDPADERVHDWPAPVVDVAWTTAVPWAVPAFWVSRARPLFLLVIW